MLQNISSLQLGYRGAMLNLLNLFSLKTFAASELVSCLAFSCPAFSRHAISCPCNFMPFKLVCQFHVLHFHVRHFQRPRYAATPAHQALKQVIATKVGHCPGTNWHRPPGRSRKTWIQQIGDGRNTGQLETDVAERRGTWTSWRVVGPLLSMRYDDDDDDGTR